MPAVPEIVEIWKVALPTVRNGVTGVGVWAALNAAIPLTVENGQFVVGLEYRDQELAGHLRLPQTRTLIEQTVSKLWGSDIALRVIDGPTLAEWETTKRRDEEARRLQDQAMARAKSQVEARSNWETVYEQLGRVFAATANKSMPQNRARFYNEALDIVVAARKSQPFNDELSERNFARCIERVGQYADVPSAIVAMHVLERLGELNK